MKLKSFSVKITLGSLFLMVAISSLLLNCKQKDENRQVAEKYCGNCHLFPEPDLLPKNVWQYSTLPYMGIMMGVETEINGLEKPLSDYIVLRPETQMISDEDWLKIKRYYLDNAPKSLKKPSYDSFDDLADKFDIQVINNRSNTDKIPNYTGVRIDTANNQIIAGDQSNRTIWIVDSQGKVKSKITNQNALTHIDLREAQKQKYLLTFIGTTTQANPDVNGSAEEIAIPYAGKNTTLLPNLNRPIEVISENLDDSPESELISNEFGFKVGGLSIWKKDKNNQYQKQVLSTQTGSTKTIVKDFNGDGKKDIIALFAQGDEQIVLFTNKGNLKFDSKQLIRVPSIYGSSSFDLADLNQDGKPDIILSAGDNADFTTVLKPYHGVYIFMNKGNFQFEKKEFYHQNGATKVIAKDFDNDGDIDLASIALFPDNDHRPLEGFIYFENKGDASFKQKSLKINDLGRWSVIDAADIDHDGDIDMVLGSHPVAKFPAGFNPKWKDGSGLVILRNKTIKK